MSRIIETSAKSANRWVWCSAGLLLLGLLIRLHGIGSQALWFDELYSATQASVAVTDVPNSVARFDMHPPLYYLQLSAWEKVNSSDVWLRLNSTFWWLLAGVSLVWVARQLFDDSVMVISALLYAVNPTGVHFAQELRMYALLMFLTVWSFYLSERFVRAPNQRNGFWLYCTMVAVIYSHGAGFLILMCMASSTLWMAWRGDVSRQAAFRFGTVQVLAVLTGVPEHVRAAAMHLHFESGLSYAIKPGLADLMRESSWLYVGRGVMLGAWTTTATLALVLGPLAIACRSEGPARRAVWFYVLTPIAACCAISHWSRPIWVFRAISFTLPCCCLALAVGMTQLPNVVKAYVARWDQRRLWRLTAIYTVGLVAFSLAAVVAQRNVYPRVSHYHALVNTLRATATERDVVFVPQTYSYWAFCWYFVHPGSVNPLTDNGVQTRTGGPLIAKAHPWDDQGRQLMEQRPEGDCYLLILGRPQAAEMLREVDQQCDLDADQVATGATLGLWKLTPRKNGGSGA